MDQVDQLSATFAALADPTRRAILARLAGGEATVSELAEPFALSLPAISKHLRVLQRAGLIEQGRQAQWRPCRLRPEPLRDVADWIGTYGGTGSRASSALTSTSANCSRRSPAMTVESETRTATEGATAVAVQQLGNERTTAYAQGDELVFERVFDAPRELVWKVVTDPQRMTNWWGPPGYT